MAGAQEAQPRRPGAFRRPGERPADQPGTQAAAAEGLRDLALVESRAHALVDKDTFPFLNGVARYLPNECLADVDARLNELGDQFRHEQREFLRQYPTYRENALREWETTARELVDDPTRLVAVIEDAFPPANAVDRHYGFQVKMLQVAVPEMPQADLVEAATQRTEYRSHGRKPVGLGW